MVRLLGVASRRVVAVSAPFRVRESQAVGDLGEAGGMRRHIEGPAERREGKAAPGECAERPA